MGPIHLNSNTINVILTAVVIGTGTIAVAGWLTPNFLRMVAVRLLARAEAIEASRTGHSEAMRYWAPRLERARLTIAAGGERS